MKHKFVKIAVIAAAASITVGGICLGAGLAMGGSPNFYYDDKGIHVKENASLGRTPDYVMEYTKTGTIKNLDISLNDAELEIVSGQEWAVEYVLGGWRTEPEYSLEGQTLKIKESAESQYSRRHTLWGWGDCWWYDGEGEGHSTYVKITVPEAGKLEQVTISGEYGDVSIEKNLKAQNVSADVEYGVMRLDGWEGDSLTVDMGYGDLTVGDLKGKNATVRNRNGSVKTGALQVDAVEIDMEYGDLTAGNMEGNGLRVKNDNGAVKMGALQADAVEIDMKYGNLTAAVRETSDLEVNNENGSVTLELSGGMDKYGVSLHTDWGTIRTPQGRMEADDDGSSEFIRTVDGVAKVRVYTEYGDVRVRDEE